MRGCSLCSGVFCGGWPQAAAGVSAPVGGGRVCPVLYLARPAGEQSVAGDTEGKTLTHTHAVTHAHTHSEVNQLF